MSILKYIPSASTSYRIAIRCSLLFAALILLSPMLTEYPVIGFGSADIIQLLSAIGMDSHMAFSYTAFYVVLIFCGFLLCYVCFLHLTRQLFVAPLPMMTLGLTLLYQFMPYHIRILYLYADLSKMVVYAVLPLIAFFIPNIASKLGSTISRIKQRLNSIKKSSISFYGLTILFICYLLYAVFMLNGIAYHSHPYDLSTYSSSNESALTEIAQANYDGYISWLLY